MEEQRDVSRTHVLMKKHVQTELSTADKEKEIKLSKVMVYVVAGACFFGMMMLLGRHRQQMIWVGTEWIKKQGDVLGPVYYVIFLALWIAMLLPSSIVEIIPGYLFGSFRTGFLVVLVGKNLGNMICFFVAKHLFRERIQTLLFERFPTAKAFARAIELEGFKVILMIRLSYMPMVVKNYGLSTLDVSFGQAMLASLIAGMPFAALWTAIGVSSQNFGDILEGKRGFRDALEMLPENKFLIFGVGLVAVSLFAFVALSFRRRFKEIIKQAEDDPGADASTMKKQQ